MFGENNLCGSRNLQFMICWKFLEKAGKAAFLLYVPVNKKGARKNVYNIISKLKTKQSIQHFQLVTTTLLTHFW